MQIKDYKTGIIYEVDDDPVIHVDSRDLCDDGDDAMRWGVKDLYERDGDYILVSIGMSDVPGEEDRYTVDMANNLSSIIMSMRRRNRNGMYYFTDLAKEVISKMKEIYGDEAVMRI